MAQEHETFVHVVDDLTLEVEVTYSMSVGEPTIRWSAEIRSRDDSLDFVLDGITPTNPSTPLDPGVVAAMAARRALTRHLDALRARSRG